MIYINDDISHFDFTASISRLSAQRLNQALRYRHDLGRKLNAAAYLLLRQGLSVEYDITEPPELGYNEHGKPYVLGHPEVHFNLSHCRVAVVCALSRHPVGIDVESIRPLNESLVRYTMNDAEVSEIMSSPRPDLAFTCLWTKKEALLKLLGTGISGKMKDVLQGMATPHTVVELDKGYVYSVAGEEQFMDRYK
jgi:4'-phosphopantetheinyl transferase